MGHTVQELKEMPFDKLQALVEGRLDRKLDDTEAMWLALISGASKVGDGVGVSVYELDKGISYNQYLNWEHLASFLNE